MPDNSWQEHVGERVRVFQIIVGALFAGCLVFLAVAVVVVRQAAPAAGQGLEILTLVAVGEAAATIFACAIVPTIMVRRGRQAILRGDSPVPMSPGLAERMADFYAKTGDAGKLMVLYQAKTIVAAAMLEGAAFFALVIYLLGQDRVSLALGVLLSVGVGLHMPTRSGVIRWIDGQLLLMEQERREQW